MSKVKRSSLLLSLVGSAMAGTTDHWVLNHAQTLALSRMDPIISPGAVSSHVHNVFGGSAFSSERSPVRSSPSPPKLETPLTSVRRVEDLTSFDQMEKSACSTIVVGADKSNYWAPYVPFPHPYL